MYAHAYVTSYDGGIKSLECSDLRLKRKSTQYFCVAMSSVHVIPKMISKNMWGEEMKSDIVFEASLRSLLYECTGGPHIL